MNSPPRMSSIWEQEKNCISRDWYDLLVRLILFAIAAGHVRYEAQTEL